MASVFTRAKFCIKKAPPEKSRNALSLAGRFVPLTLLVIQLSWLMHEAYLATRPNFSFDITLLIINYNVIGVR